MRKPSYIEELRHLRKGHMGQRSTTSTTVEFFGAAETVTGSRHLVTHGDKKVLLDCGLFQGLKALRQRNWEAPPFDSSAIDAVVLSHAHIDHSGYLPLLSRLGFDGPIYCTAATLDLLGILLRDAAFLQEEQAAHANKFGYSRHKPALPLYTMEDVEATLPLLRACPYETSFTVDDGIEAAFRCAGHILGSASVELNLDRGAGKKIVFVREADVLLMESTYGNRTHQGDPDEELARVVTEAAHRGGAVIIPAFAVGRTQEVLWRLRALEDAGRIPALPVYADSPMALNVTDVYRRHPEEHDLEMAALRDSGRAPLKPRLFATARTAHESKALNNLEGPVILISASGMASGGRVLHHLKRRLPDHRNTVLLTGFQAAGTRGRALQDGAKEVRMHGQEVRVRARVETVHGLSAHADRDEMMRWLSGFEKAPKATYTVHGEAESARGLAGLIESELGWKAAAAKDGGTAVVG
jgi:metallo-beta-lactamase family protein